MSDELLRDGEEQERDESLTPLARDYLKRQQAYYDFLRLGPNRTVEALWRQYCELAREDPDGSSGLRKRVPTTNRNILFRWAREDRWRERAAEYDRQVNEEHVRQTEEVRLEALRRLSLLGDLVIETLEQLLRESKRDDVRLRAIETWLDRMGIIRPSLTAIARMIEKHGGQTQERATDATPVELPDPEAPEDVWIKFLYERRS